jgi:hypothetical protein
MTLPGYFPRVPFGDPGPADGEYLKRVGDVMVGAAGGGAATPLTWIDTMIADGVAKTGLVPLETTVFADDFVDLSNWGLDTAVHIDGTWVGSRSVGGAGVLTTAVASSVQTILGNSGAAANMVPVLLSNESPWYIAVRMIMASSGSYENVWAMLKVLKWHDGEGAFLGIGTSPDGVGEPAFFSVYTADGAGEPVVTRTNSTVGLMPAFATFRMWQNAAGQRYFSVDNEVPIEIAAVLPKARMILTVFAHAPALVTVGITIDKVVAVCSCIEPPLA